MSFFVAKVGGSLLDLPDLEVRLSRWIKSQSQNALLVVGGGPEVQALRELDAEHHLGDARCHWLALAVMTANAQHLAELMPNARVVATDDDMNAAWSNRHIPILDALSFCRADETSADHLPHRWSVSSDSVAARVAIVWKAKRLVLLKSTPPGGNVEDWSANKFVDTHFALLTSSLEITALNFRESVSEARP